MKKKSFPRTCCCCNSALQSLHSTLKFWGKKLLKCKKYVYKQAHVNRQKNVREVGTVCERIFGYAIGMTNFSLESMSDTHLLHMDGDFSPKNTDKPVTTLN